MGMILKSKMILSDIKKNIVKQILRVILGKIDILKQVDWLKEQKADVILLYRIWISNPK